MGQEGEGRHWGISGPSDHQILAGSHVDGNGEPGVRPRTIGAHGIRVFGWKSPRHHGPAAGQHRKITCSPHEQRATRVHELQVLSKTKGEEDMSYG